MSERTPERPHTRRAVLGAAVAGAAVLAGCGAYGGEASDADVLTGEMENVKAADDDSLIVVVSVENPSEQSRTATLYVYVTITEKTHRKAREVTVDAGSTAEYEVAFEDITTKEFWNGGSTSLSLE